MLQCGAVCCIVVQCVAVCCSVVQRGAVCCSVVQCVTVCCSVLQCVAVCCNSSCHMSCGVVQDVGVQISHFTYMNDLCHVYDRVMSCT